VHVVLVAPEIAANTGNIIRLCANTGAALHLVGPLGFRLDDRNLRRAGLDYHELAEVAVHATLDEALVRCGAAPDRCFALSGRGARRYDQAGLGQGDVVVFGAERAGLPAAVLDRFPADRCLRVPMRPGNRSLNLANAVAVVVYEAWRRDGFTGEAGAERAGAERAGAERAGAERPGAERPGAERAVGDGTGPTLAETPASAPFDP
jgi:tRNA (cytidine/uridine-2'-O-)-methyltransferase